MARIKRGYFAYFNITREPLSEYYIVCDNGVDAIKTGPVWNMWDAQVILNESKNDRPEHKYWIMESWRDDFGDTHVEVHHPFMWN